MSDLDEKFIRETLVFQGTVSEAIGTIKNDIKGMREEGRDRAEKIYTKIEEVKDGGGQLNGRVKVVEAKQKMANKKSGYIGGTVAGFFIAIKIVWDWIRG